MKTVLFGYGTHVMHEEMQLIIETFEKMNKDRETSNLIPIDFEIKDFFVSD